MTTVQPTNREVITRKDTKKAVDEYHSVPRVGMYVQDCSTPSKLGMRQSQERLGMHNTFYKCPQPGGRGGGGGQDRKYILLSRFRFRSACTGNKQRKRTKKYIRSI